MGRSSIHAKRSDEAADCRHVKVRPDVAIQVQSLTVQAVWLLIFFPLMYSVTIAKSQEVGMCVSDSLILSFFI